MSWGDNAMSKKIIKPVPGLLSGGIQLPQHLGPGTPTFEQDYRLLAHYQVIPGEAGRPRYIGRENPRVCRLCGKSTPEATFKKESHVIPESLGNRELRSYEECDECNAYFGRELEDHLSKFLGPERALTTIKTKKGKLKHKYRKSSIQSGSEDDPVKLTTHVDDDSIEVRRLDDHQLELRIRKQPHSIMRAMKAIARIGFLSVPSSAVSRLEYTRQWLRSEVEATGHLVQVHIPGPGVRTVNSWVYERKQAIIGQPRFVYAINFGMNALYTYCPQVQIHDPRQLPFPPIGISPYPPYSPSVQITPAYEDIVREEQWSRMTIASAVGLDNEKVDALLRLRDSTKDNENG